MRRPISLSLTTVCSFTATALLLTAAGTANAQRIYVGSSESGSVVLSSFRSASAPRVLLDETQQLSGHATERRSPKPRSPELDRMIEQAAIESSVSSNLLHAIIDVESGYDVRAVSPKGAQGLMQLMPLTARQFGVADPFDPKQNIRAGAAYLRTLLDRFDGDTTLALAAYNAGEAAVIRSGRRVPDFAETRAYVPRVLAASARLQ